MGIRKVWLLYHASMAYSRGSRGLALVYWLRWINARRAGTPLFVAQITCECLRSLSDIPVIGVSRTREDDLPGRPGCRAPTLGAECDISSERH